MNRVLFRSIVWLLHSFYFVECNAYPLETHFNQTFPDLLLLPRFSFAAFRMLPLCTAECVCDPTYVTIAPTTYPTYYIFEVHLSTEVCRISTGPISQQPRLSLATTSYIAPTRSNI